MKKVYIAHYDSDEGSRFAAYTSTQRALRGAEEWQEQLRQDHGMKWTDHQDTSWSNEDDKWMSIVTLRLND